MQPELPDHHQKHADMPAAFAADNLDPVDPKTVIEFQINIIQGNRSPETWPTAP
jgi:hypothetical protein